MSQAGIVSIANGGGATQFNEDSGSAVPAAGIINILGGVGISTTGAGNTVTINSTAGAFDWNVVVGAAQALAAENGYINTNAGLTTFTLPVAAAVGDTYQIAGYSAAGWTIAQNAGQSIHVVNATSTVGVAGSVSSNERYDCIELVCVVANNEFTAVSFTGNLTVA